MARGVGRVLAQYRGLTPFQRAYAAVRWRICPFDRVLPFVPRAGRALDVGCGVGLWLSYLSLERPELELAGLDPDPRKLAAVRASGSQAISVYQGDALNLPQGPFDLITIFDVLYLMPDEEKRRVLAGCFERLSAGGTLLVKELDVRPAWKFVPAAAEEWLAVRLVNLTYGERLYFQGVEALAGEMEVVGFDGVEISRIDGGYLHPHVLVRGGTGNEGGRESA
jgi:SAM-dependent methyltransferase